MSFTDPPGEIRNVDIQLHVTYGPTTTGGPAFRLVKYNNVAAKLQNLRISGYVKGKPNTSIGDIHGPIIGTEVTYNYGSASDEIRNITLSDLRVESSKFVRFAVPGLKGPFLIQNVVSDNSVQLLESNTPPLQVPSGGRYTVVNSSFPNLATHYFPESAQPLDPINAAGTVNVPAGWHGHTLSNEHAGVNVTYTLPSAVPGLEYGVVRVKSLLISVRPQATETIRGTSAGWALNLNSTGAHVRLRCVVAGVWEIVDTTPAGSTSFSP
jgi:hypothetical protein